MEVAEKTLAEFLDSYNFAWRRNAFMLIAQELCALERPVMICETGCMRAPNQPDHEFEDGQSTLVWDYLATMTGGKAISIDMNPENCAYARERVGPNTTIYEANSIQFLSNAEFEHKIDLLYLDSMDYTKQTAFHSALNHAGELAAAWEHLESGAIVAVDDCIGPYNGKHALVKCFFEILGGVLPSGISHISWWKKP